MAIATYVAVAINVIVAGRVDARRRATRVEVEDHEPPVGGRARRHGTGGLPGSWASFIRRSGYRG